MIVFLKNSSFSQKSTLFAIYAKILRTFWNNLTLLYPFILHLRKVIFPVKLTVPYSAWEMQVSSWNFFIYRDRRSKLAEQIGFKEKNFFTNSKRKVRFYDFISKKIRNTKWYSEQIWFLRFINIEIKTSSFL